MTETSGDYSDFNAYSFGTLSGLVCSSYEPFSFASENSYSDLPEVTKVAITTTRRNLIFII